MRVAISGSSGFVGSRLVSELVNLGHEVTRLARPSSVPPSDSESLASSQKPVTAIRSIEWDPRKGLSDPTQLSGFDALVHLAGKSIAAGRWSPEVRQAIRDSRVLATQILAEQLQSIDAPPQTIVSASAIGIYGDCGQDPVTEAAPAADDFLAEVAVEWENACLPLADAGFRVVHPRLGIVLGREGGALQKMLPLFRFMIGGRLGSGQQYWSWISLRDCVSAIIWLLENDKASGAYNLTAPNPVTNAEFTRELGQQTRRPTILPAPAFALRLAMGEMADALLLNSCRVLPEKLLASGFKFTDPELDLCLVHELNR